MQSKEKDYVSQYNKSYQTKNKANLQAKRMIKDKCDICGKMISHSYIIKHKKTPICQNNKQ